MAPTSPPVQACAFPDWQPSIVRQRSSGSTQATCSPGGRDADEECPGAILHREIPPECWCVTASDLRALRREVRQAVREGRIVPTARDAFDPADEEVGPNFYTVVEQYVKAATARSGASWALERHPGGLECDLFITHAWVEGIYEFVGKVLWSWPLRARHAWICTLSMPQHLDISELISDPRSSPFAKALGSASQILVVPNRRSSVYTRLWCVYEAFLAQEKGKTIRTAVRQKWRGLAASVATVLVTCGIGIGGAAAFRPPTEKEGYVLAVAVWVLLALSLLVRGSHLRRCIHWVGAGVAAYSLLQPDLHKLHDIAYFIAAEVDLVRLSAYKEASRSLINGFEGSVIHAKCSRPADKDAIWKDIGSDVKKVDDTVDVLIQAKQSTPLWSHLARLAYPVRDVGFTHWALPVYTLVAAAYHGYEGFTDRVDELHLILLVVIVQALWCMSLLCLHIDRRAFSVLLLEKAMAVYLFAHGVIICMAAGKSEDMYAMTGLLRSIYSLSLGGFVFLLSGVSPLLVIRVPVIGPCLVEATLRHLRFHYGRSLPRCFKGEQ